MVLDPLDSLDWEGLEQLHWQAREVPDALRDMARGPEADRSAALGTARDILFEHGVVSKLAAYVVPALLQRLRLGLDAGEPRVLHLLRGLAEGGWPEAFTPSRDVAPPGPPPEAHETDFFADLETEAGEAEPRSDLWLSKEEVRTLLGEIRLQDLGLLRASDPRLRIAAIALVTVLPDGASLGPDLVDLLQTDSSPDVRASAALALQAMTLGRTQVPADASVILATRAHEDDSALVQCCAAAATVAVAGVAPEPILTALERGLRLPNMDWLDFPWEQATPWKAGRPAMVALRALGMLVPIQADRVAQVLRRYLFEWRDHGDEGTRQVALLTFARSTLGRFANRGWEETRAEELTEAERDAVRVLAAMAPPNMRLGYGLPLAKDLAYFLDDTRPLNLQLEAGGETFPIWRQFRRYAYGSLERSCLLTAVWMLPPTSAWSAATDVAAGVYAEIHHETMLPSKDLMFLVEMLAPARASLNEEFMAYAQKLASNAAGSGPATSVFAPYVLVALPLAMNLRERGQVLPEWLMPVLRRAGEAGPMMRAAVQEYLVGQASGDKPG
jgi:hypothetical protein